MALLLLIGFAFVLVIILFAFPRFSPIPYFPTNKKDLSKIKKTLKLRNNQTIIDLGAGDGIVVFEAAKQAFSKKLNTKFVAVELNPILILILHVRRLLHPNRKNIKVVLGDMFKMKLKTQMSNVKTVYLYISPWYLERVYEKLKRELKSFELISYFYPIPKLIPIKKIKGVHSIFIYNIKHA